MGDKELGEGDTVTQTIDVLGIDVDLDDSRYSGKFKLKVYRPLTFTCIYEFEHNYRSILLYTHLHYMTCASIFYIDIPVSQSESGRSGSSGSSHTGRGIF